MSETDEPAPERRGFPGLWPVLGLFALYFLTVLGGVLLSDPFERAGVPTFENPDSVLNVGIIFAEILVFTAVFILIVRYDVGRKALRALILAVFAYASYLAAIGVLASLPSTGLLAAAVALVVFGLLWVYPEWYVIDATAVLAGAAIIAQLGNGLGPLPVLLFLVGMATYDAYAVYVSEHMQALGGGVGELRLPMVYVVPQSLSFSMADLGNPFEDDESGSDGPEDSTGAHDASSPADEPDGASGSGEERVDRPILLGLGDAVVPGLLAVSGGRFLDAPSFVEGTVLNAPAVGAVAGSVVGLVGLLVLLYVVERTHAGLPILNACVILGYLAGVAYAGLPLRAAVGL